MTYFADTDSRHFGDAARRAVPPRWRSFFLLLAAVLLVGLLAGFARTFFLRGFFDVPPLPMYLYGHGAVLTSWFVLVFIQASLVSARRLDVHRRLGVAGAVIAALVVLISPLVVVRSNTAFGGLGD